MFFSPYKRALKAPRYIRQRDDYSCGAIALLNALKWAGYNIIYKRDFGRARRACRTNFDGTFSDNFDKAIRRYKKLIVLPEESPFLAPSIDLIDEHLSNGGSFVISYIYRYNGIVQVSHIALCIGKIGNRYVFVNNSQRKFKRTVSFTTRRTLIKMLRFKDKNCGECEVWFLHKAR